jgi:integrase
MDRTMQPSNQLLTDKAIAKMPFASERQYRIRDSELSGFFVCVGKRSKSFMAEAEKWQDGVRELRVQTKLGTVGEISTREARSLAKEVLGQVSKGIRPGEAAKPKPGAITLRGAWERYRESHMIRKGRDQGTIANYRDHMERLFTDWLDRPLSRLGRQPSLVVDRHNRITNENGPYIANGSMRSLRAIYNHARKSNPDLPPVNPVTAIDWNKERRRNTGMGDVETGLWLEELHSLTNPIRREFHLFVLLSGSRPTAIKRIRIEHIDLRQRIVHIPRPKGGEDKAFDIPLSRAMIRCIVRTMRLARQAFPDQAEFWLFPADSASGHITEHKEDRKLLSKWGNDLRQSYRTLAQIAEVSALDVHLLMNHSLPGVNAGYITRDRLLGGHLRNQQERISAIVLKSGNVEVTNWLKSYRVKVKNF